MVTASGSTGKPFGQAFYCEKEYRGAIDELRDMLAKSQRLVLPGAGVFAVNLGESANGV